MSANLYALFKSRFPGDLAQPFLTLRDGSVVSYGDVDTKTAQLAHRLTHLGVFPGSRIAVQVEKSPTALLLYLACLRSGAVYLPLNTAYTGDELDYFLADAAPTVVVVDPKCIGDIKSRAKQHAVSHVLTLDSAGHGTLTDQLPSTDITFDTVERYGDDLAAILYSSGTTGQPKGVMLSHDGLAANALALHAAWQFKSSDVVLHALPIFHTHGLFVATNTVLINGTSMIFHDRYDPEAIVADLPKATVFMGVPTYYSRLLAHGGLSEDACQSIRLFISGSAPLLDETFQSFAAHTGHTIVERYGMTEAGIITSTDLDKPRSAGTVGWPLSGVGLRITDENDKTVSNGETGDVQINGSSLFSGYWNKPDKTAEEFTEDGFFRTGDIGRIEPDGQLTLVGRAKDMYISGGFNVYPKEIEQTIDAMPGVEESAVIGLPHPDFGEAGLAIVVGENLDPDLVRSDLKDSLANYKVPKLVVPAQELPRNAMGKVQKALLRENYLAAWKDFLNW